MENAPELSERERAILDAVVYSYITSAEPVGSRTVVKRFGMDLSAATVRNVMADLEEMGYLQQLHTSSGRVPTDKGYRYYVSNLMQVQELTMTERQRIEQEFQQRLTDADDVLRQASHLLALVSHHAGVAESPGGDAAELVRLDLIYIGENRLAVLVVDNFGRVKSMSVELASPITLEELTRMSRFLNDHLRGTPVDRLAAAVEEKLRGFLDEQRLLAQRSLEVLHLLPRRSQGQLFLEGASQLFEQPEFQQVGHARGVFNLIEGREHLMELLRRAALEGESDRGTVIIGGEGGGGMEEMGMVASPYKVNNKTVGMIGVLGPKRMHYSRLLGAVEYTADLVGKFLTRLKA